ncbi:MAG: small ribosomal subunit Rsm22 family protein [Pseudobdellovibrio sp.]
MFSINPPPHLNQLATDILRLSDFFIQKPDGQTPWTDTYCQNAYRNYFLPLNYIRVENVIQRGMQVEFFKGFETTLDWGSGPGTASLAFAHEPTLKAQLKNQILIERSSSALKTFNDFNEQFIHPHFSTELSFDNLSCNKTKTLLTFSYSLTEMNALPKGWNDFEGLMILEPATHQDGRKLLELRQKLIAEGYSIWAPCLHQNDCPLLTLSKNDWCHDRFHVNAPAWFLKLEDLLPMKNRTVTTSYLLARKTKPSIDPTNKARLTGDSMKEKGKTRQLICRSSEREFLSWMHKNKSEQTLPRGELVLLSKDLEQKSNELRVTETPIECYENSHGKHK